MTMRDDAIRAALELAFELVLFNPNEHEETKVRAQMEAALALPTAEPARDPLSMSDEEVVSAVRACASRILDPQSSTGDWCVYVSRMRELLAELHGKPPEHGDFRDSLRGALLAARSGRGCPEDG